MTTDKKRMILSADEATQNYVEHLAAAHDLYVGRVIHALIDYTRTQADQRSISAWIKQASEDYRAERSRVGKKAINTRWHPDKEE